VANASLLGQAATDFVILKSDDVTPTSVRLTIIVVATKTDAESVRQKLQSGASFEALAREYSRHPSAPDGGEFGVFPPGDLPQEFRAALDRVKPGGYTEVIAVPRPATPPGWPDGVPVPGTSLKEVERLLGRAYSSSTKLPADGQSAMTELTYHFGLRLRIHEARGLGFIEFTPPWKTTIFGVRPDDPMPASIYDLFPRTGRFIRGVLVGVPSHPNWYVDVDDRVDAVTRVLFVDRGIYGNLPDVPKGH
jgi:hypothetical protein